MRIKLVISYDGTNYSGWQVQNNATSIQDCIEQAIFNLTGEKLRVTASGRTDAGVHARGQVASFETQSQIPPEKFYKAINTYLPSDIRVISSERANDSFCACRSAKRKTYVYTVYESDVELPLLERYAVRINKIENFEMMLEVAKVFVGEHDFKCFCASGSGVKTTVRNLYDIKIERENGVVKFYFTGNGFLYNMVRTLVGTLLKAGKGALNIQDAVYMLENKDRTLVGETMPAKGLTLYSVEYV